MVDIDWSQTVRSIWVCPNHLGSILCSRLEPRALPPTPQARKWKQRLERSERTIKGQEGTGRKTLSFLTCSGSPLSSPNKVAWQPSSLQPALIYILDTPTTPDLSTCPEPHSRMAWHLFLPLSPFLFWLGLAHTREHSLIGWWLGGLEESGICLHVL